MVSTCLNCEKILTKYVEWAKQHMEFHQTIWIQHPTRQGMWAAMRCLENCPLVYHGLPSQIETSKTIKKSIIYSSTDRILQIIVLPSIFLVVELETAARPLWSCPTWRCPEVLTGVLQLLLWLSGAPWKQRCSWQKAPSMASFLWGFHRG